MSTQGGMPPWWSLNKPRRLGVVSESRDEQQSEEQPPLDDWLDRLWADEDLAPSPPALAEKLSTPRVTEPADVAEDYADQDDEDESFRWLRTAPGYWRVPSVPSLPVPSSLSPGAKRLLENACAVGAGYWIGIVPTIGGWIASCGRDYSISGALFLGTGLCLGIAALWDRRTRHWHLTIRWAARIPLASAVTALALYAPASQI
ncbi:hypothetical protein [Streptomyces subrutilus]|uniref:hypothetical protein n=1 Tax=Streptomyces subrutilus TaxID=36818 RepID=UPI0033E9ECC2